jgi:Phage integrase family
VDNGASIAAVQKVMGHKSVETTMQYVHATDEGKRERLKRWKRRRNRSRPLFRSQFGHKMKNGVRRDLLRFLILWWPLEDSNLQPKDYESSALPLS